MLTEALLTRFEADLHVGPQFVEMCGPPFYANESAAFLMAVIRYKRNSSWHDILRICHKHIDNDATEMVNLPSDQFEAINKYVKFWMDSQKGLAEQKVALHLGAPNPNLFNGAFDSILGLLQRKEDLEANFREAVAKFAAKYGIA